MNAAELLREVNRLMAEAQARTAAGLWVKAIEAACSDPRLWETFGGFHRLKQRAHDAVRVLQEALEVQHHSRIYAHSAGYKVVSALDSTTVRNGTT